MVEPSLEEIEAVLEPYVAQRMPVASDEWQARIGKLERKWRKRMRNRRLFGWLPRRETLPSVLSPKRSQTVIQSEYERIWAESPLPGTAAARAEKPTLAEWRGEGLLIRRGGCPRIHLLFMSKALDRLRPKTVLEVGAGYGMNLFALSARHPEISWHGVELTEAGVARARRLQQAPQLADDLAPYIPWEVADPSAFGRIDFRVGNAMQLPFEDSSFDVVITRQALEQMEQIREEAVAEIARVARQAVILVEPFADFNESALQRNAVAATDYFSLPVSGVERHGIIPRVVTGAFPQKVRLGQGMVVGEVAG